MEAETGFRVQDMKIRNKILLLVLIILTASEIFITTLWYRASANLTEKYLNDVSSSAMYEAYQAFDYLLTDTSYMAMMISLNKKNIIQPVEELKNNVTSTGTSLWNDVYLTNKRIIDDFITGMNGYKYYIVGISVVVNEDYIVGTSSITVADIYQNILTLNQNNLKTGMVMMDPHLVQGKSTLSSDYVIPAVKAILDSDREIIGYVVLYFDYSVIEEMFFAGLPEGSRFQVHGGNQTLIFSNCGEELIDGEDQEGGFIYNTYEAKNIGWEFVMAIPSDYYAKSLNRTALISVMVSVGIFIAAVLLVILVISKMTAEISCLQQSMQKVSDGSLDVHYKVASRDEIGQMGNTFNLMIEQIHHLMDRIGEEEKEKRLVEIAFLEAQINPHFVSNVLNNVVWMAKLQHADNIIPLVQSLNAMLQNVMHQERDLLPLEDELRYIDHYLEIAEYSSYQFVVEKEIERGTGKLLVLRFILQPILENAIYHGMPGDLSRERRILIKSAVCDGKLCIVVEDNGKGMTEEQIQEIMVKKKEKQGHFNGIGIPNVNDRIHLFFGEQYGLHYESCIGKYTRAIFLLPVLTGEEEL